MVSKVVNIALRAFQFLCTLIVMALVGNMIASAFAGNPASVNFAMFTASFGMFSLIYLGAVAFNEAFMGHAIIPLILDVLNTIFFFCAAVVLAARLEVHSCDNRSYTAHNSVTSGSRNQAKRCREGQASCAFLWFGFAAFVASLFMSAFATGRPTVNLRGPRGNRGGPSMSQV